MLKKGSIFQMKEYFLCKVLDIRPREIPHIPSRCISKYGENSINYLSQDGTYVTCLYLGRHIKRKVQ